MARTLRKSLCLAALAVWVTVPALAMAAGKEKAPTMTMDVQELNSKASQYLGQKVSVAGEIEEKHGPRSFVLESGGLFNDEILVIVPKDVQGLKAQQLREDANIVVTGTVRTMSVLEVERELDWDFDPELEIELEEKRNYLVAEQITRQRE